LLLIVALAVVVVSAFTLSPVYLVGYLMILLGIAALRGAYALIRTREKMFMLFPLYAFMHLFMLLPTRMYALCTLKATKWGTR